jgi:hypothetical protein
MDVNLKIKFQGLDSQSKVKTLPIKVKLGRLNMGNVSAYQVINVTNESGFWLGKATFNNMTPADDYIIYIKGPKHTQKKICDSAPQESVPGSYFCDGKGIKLQNDNNSFDMSGIVLFAGDLPPQDGVVNSFDVMEIVDAIKNSKYVEAADLNYD